MAFAGAKLQEIKRIDNENCRKSSRGEAVHNPVIYCCWTVDGSHTAITTCSGGVVETTDE